MAVFCTQCGTSNAAENAFCDQCGSPVRRAVAPAAAAAAGPSAAAVRSQKPLRIAAAVGGVLLLAGGALYFALAAPAPTQARLLAAAKLGYGEALNRQGKQGLCLTNMEYSDKPFNAAQYDQRSQAWLDTLVLAGLYRPGTPITQSGYFGRTLIQYSPTPELKQWLDGGRLCVGKGIEVADVVDIRQPTQETLGKGADSATLQLVKAKIVLRAVDTPPWLDNAEVQGPVLARMSGWEYTAGKLHKQVDEVFGLQENQWKTGPAYGNGLQKQVAAARRAERDRAQSARTTPSSEGIFAGLGQLFSFGGHPLQGTWRLDMGDSAEGQMAAGLLGMAGLAEITFTRNAMEVGGESVQCKFEVDGQRVKVTPEGKSKSDIYKMRDKNTMVMGAGFSEVTYTRAP